MPESQSAIGSRDDLSVDLSRCLKMRFNASRCRRCVDICPHQAVTLDDGLAINPDQCSGCLLCTTVCPVGALESSRSDFFICLAQLSKVPEPVLGCIRTKKSANATLACLGGLADEHLLMLSHTLTGSLTLNLTSCPDCPNHSMTVHLRKRLDSLAEDRPFGRKCRLVLADSAEKLNYSQEVVDRRSFFKSVGHYLFKGADTILFPQTEQVQQRSEYGEKRLPLRRELLNRIRATISPEGAGRIRKDFEFFVSFADNCTSCQGCVAICPTGALQTKSSETPPGFDHLLCTGCGLCSEFCLDGAVQIYSGTTTIYADTTGIILAGGRSRRMGQDKATLVVAGATLFDRTLTMLRSLFPRVLIAGDRPDLAQADLPCVADIYPGSALGGIHSGLSAATTEWAFVSPCDLAFPDAELARFILQHRNGYDVVVLRTPGGLEPVFALYHKRCLPAMEGMLTRGDYRIYDLYDQVRVCYLDMETLPDGWQRALLNLNTPEDLQRLDKETL